MKPIEAYGATDIDFSTLAHDHLLRPAAAMTPASLIEKAVVWESAVGWTPECLDEGPSMLPRYHNAGFSCLSMTIGADWDRPEPTLRHFAQQRRYFENRSDLCRIVDSVEAPSWS